MRLRKASNSFTHVVAENGVPIPVKVWNSLIPLQEGLGVSISQDLSYRVLIKFEAEGMNGQLNIYPKEGTAADSRYKPISISRLIEGGS